MTTLDPTQQSQVQPDSSISSTGEGKNQGVENPSLAEKPLQLPTQPGRLATKPGRLADKPHFSIKLPPAGDRPELLGRPFAKPLQLELRRLPEPRDPQAADALVQLVSDHKPPLAGGPMRRAILDSLAGGGRLADVAADFRAFAAENRHGLTGEAQIMVRHLEGAATTALGNGQDKLDGDQLKTLRKKLSAVRFRAPGAGRTIAELIGKLEHGKIGVRDLAQGLRAATFGRGGDFFRQVADLRDFVDSHPGALGDRAAKLFNQLQGRIDQAMDRGVPPTGSERRELLSEIFGMIPAGGKPAYAKPALVKPKPLGDLQPVIPEEGLRQDRPGIKPAPLGEPQVIIAEEGLQAPSGHPVSVTEILIHRRGNTGLEPATVPTRQVPTRLANRFGTDRLVKRLANGEQPVSGQDLAKGLLRALSGRNREQLGGLQWANLRDGLEKTGLKLTPEAEKVVARYGQLAGELRDDGRVGATRKEFAGLIHDLEEIVGQRIRPRLDKGASAALKRFDSLPKPVSGDELAQIFYAGTNDRDGNFLGEFRTFRRGLRDRMDELGPEAKQVFDVFRKYAAEVRRSDGDGLPSGRYESFLADLENAAGSNLLRFETLPYKPLPRPIKPQPEILISQPEVLDGGGLRSGGVSEPQDVIDD